MADAVSRTGAGVGALLIVPAAGVTAARPAEDDGPGLPPERRSEVLQRGVVLGDLDRVVGGDEVVDVDRIRRVRTATDHGRRRAAVARLQAPWTRAVREAG